MKTANVIDFAAVLNSRRAANQKAEQAAAQEKRDNDDRQKGYEAVGFNPLAMILVDAVMDKQKAEKQDRPMPAYCDPANETRGSKYDATKGMTRVQIAARIRQDIKDAMAAGILPKGIKVSVRTESYSGGGSIDVRVTALPEGFTIWNPSYLAWRQENPNDGWPPFNAHDQKTEEYHALIQKLAAIQDAYNRDNSDSMSDYFDRRYYGDVSIEWQLADALKKAEIAALPRKKG